jgi:NAD(P)-dependent dehydrogenase (short-subunit alcohol dehydrogenase family)
MSLITIVGMGPGIGAPVARRFAREGSSIAAIARNAQALARQIDALKSVSLRASGDVAAGSSHGCAMCLDGRAALGTRRSTSHTFAQYQLNRL